MAAPANVCRSSASCARRCSTRWRSWLGKDVHARRHRQPVGHTGTSSSPLTMTMGVRLAASCMPESEVPPQGMPFRYGSPMTA